MRYSEALKLHTEDEVTIKESGAVVRVREITVFPAQPNVDAMVIIIDENAHMWAHTEIA